MVQAEIIQIVLKKIPALALINGSSVFDSIENENGIGIIFKIYYS